MLKQRNKSCNFPSCLTDEFIQSRQRQMPPLTPQLRAITRTMTVSFTGRVVVFEQIRIEWRGFCYYSCCFSHLSDWYFVMSSARLAHISTFSSATALIVSTLEAVTLDIRTYVYTRIQPETGNIASICAPSIMCRYDVSARCYKPNTFAAICWNGKILSSAAHVVCTWRRYAISCRYEYRIRFLQLSEVIL